ncbi:hypothetical protein V3564_05235 [Bartonella sp. B12(2025)]
MAFSITHYTGVGSIANRKDLSAQAFNALKKEKLIAILLQNGF